MSMTKTVSTRRLNTNNASTFTSSGRATSIGVTKATKTSASDVIASQWPIQLDVRGSMRKPALFASCMEEDAVEAGPGALGLLALGLRGEGFAIARLAFQLCRRALSRPCTHKRLLQCGRLRSFYFEGRERYAANKILLYNHLSSVAILITDPLRLRRLKARGTDGRPLQHIIASRLFELGRTTHLHVDMLNVPLPAPRYDDVTRAKLQKVDAALDRDEGLEAFGMNTLKLALSARNHDDELDLTRVNALPSSPRGRPRGGPASSSITEGLSSGAPAMSPRSRAGASEFESDIAAQTSNVGATTIGRRRCETDDACYRPQPPTLRPHIPGTSGIFQSSSISFTCAPAPMSMPPRLPASHVPSFDGHMYQKAQLDSARAFRHPGAGVAVPVGGVDADGSAAKTWRLGHEMMNQPWGTVLRTLQPSALNNTTGLPDSPRHNYGSGGVLGGIESPRLRSPRLGNTTSPCLSSMSARAAN